MHQMKHLIGRFQSLGEMVNIVCSYLPTRFVAVAKSLNHDRAFFFKQSLKAKSNGATFTQMIEGDIS